MTKALTEVKGAGEIQNVEDKFDWLVETWLATRGDEGKKRALKPKTLAGYRYAMKVFKNWRDSEGIDKITSADIEAYKAFMTAQGWKVTTKNMYLATICSFCRWFSDTYHVENITAGFQGWEVSKGHKRGTLSLAEMRKLMAVVCETIKDAEKNPELSKAKRKAAILKGKRDKAIITALMTGGLRTIEVTRLRVADLVTDGGVDCLNVLGKGRDDDETVKISRQAAEVIREWLAAYEETGLLSDDSPLFCSLAYNSFGEALTPHAISTLVKNYLKLAGLKEKTVTKQDKTGKKVKVVKPIVAHSLRASLATQSYLNGAKLDEVKSQLRHRQVGTTLLYIEEAEKSLNPCSDIISAAIF